MIKPLTYLYQYFLYIKKKYLDYLYSMVNKYKLVNPYIKGEFETKMDAKNSLDAAKVFYKNLSEHFNNNVPSFYFTIQKGGSGKGKFYHFEVNEKKSGDEVNYSIQPFEIKDEVEAVEQFVKNFDKFKSRFNGETKVGGSQNRSSRSRTSKRKTSKRGSRRKNESPSSESSESESYNFYREAKSYIPVTNQPLYYMYYDPLFYNVESVFLPTYNPYLYPYVEFNTMPYSYRPALYY